MSFYGSKLHITKLRNSKCKCKSCDGFQKGYNFQLHLFYLITKMVLNGTRAVNLKKKHYPSLFLIIYRKSIQKNNMPIFSQSTTCMHQKFKNKSLGRSLALSQPGLTVPGFSDLSMALHIYTRQSNSYLAHLLKNSKKHAFKLVLLQVNRQEHTRYIYFFQ